MKTLAPQVSATKLWLSVIAGAAAIFIVTTMYSAFNIVRPPDQIDEEAAQPAAERAVSSGLDTESVSQSRASSAMLIHGKKLPLPPAPANPALQKQTQLYVTPEVARKEALRMQGDYLRETSKNYPNSPLAISPEELEKMQREGRMAW